MPKPTVSNTKFQYLSSSHSTVSAELISDCLSAAFAQSTIARAEVLSGGLINTNIKIEFAAHEPPVVLRFYRTDAAVCLKETEILRLVRSTVPVPEVIHVEPDGLNDSPPFCILEFVNGLTFQDLKRTGDLEAIHQAATSAGKTLARIGKYQTSIPGLPPDEPDPIPRLLDKFLQAEHLQRRLDSSFRQQLHDFIWSWSTHLRAVGNDRNLVHSDFGNRNILVDCIKGRWQVVAVLDWEFAVSGSQLIDVGHFLRYENPADNLREPHFSRAFAGHGGVLPDDWRRLAQVIDLTGLVHCLTHAQLPDDVAVEIRQLIEATLKV